MRRAVAATVVGVVVAGVLLLGSRNAEPEPASDLRPLAPIADLGPAPELASLRAAVPEILTDWTAAGRAHGTVGDENVIELLTSSLTADAESTRREVLTGVLKPELVDPLLGRISEGFWHSLYRLQLTGTYVDNHFEVVRWQGAQVQGDTALVLLEGRQHYVFPNGTEGAEPLHQYRVRLVRDPDARYGWLLVDWSGRQVGSGREDGPSSSGG